MYFLSGVSFKAQSSPVVLHLVPSPVEAIKRLFPLTDVWCFTDVNTCTNHRPLVNTVHVAHIQEDIHKRMRLPSKRTRGLSKNISLQDENGSILVQLRPHTLKQADRQISESLKQDTHKYIFNGENLSAALEHKSL